MSKLAEEIRLLKYVNSCTATNAIEEAAQLVEEREAERGFVWTKALPTVEGWYWVRMIGEKCRPAIQYIYPCKDHLSCRGDPITSFIYVEWAGPINLPESEAL